MGRKRVFRASKEHIARIVNPKQNMSGMECQAETVAFVGCLAAQQGEIGQCLKFKQALEKCSRDMVCIFFAFLFLVCLCIVSLCCRY